MSNLTNFAHMTRKAWDIIGYTHNGAAYCPDCAINGDVALGCDSPIFASDDCADMFCDSCGDEIV